MQNENCHQDAIYRNIKPKFSQQIPFRTLFTEIARNVRVLGRFCMKLLNYVVQEHASTIGVAMVTKSGRRQLKTNVYFENEFI